MSDTTATPPPVREKYIFYHYDPTVVGAGIFAAIFFLSAAIHLAQIVRKRTWYFIPLLVGAVLEGGGYIGRIVSASDKEALGPYLINTLFLLVAPALLAASIYIILGRLMIHVEGEHHSIIPVRFVTKLFVTGDVLSFLLQSGGGGLMGAGKLDMMEMGEKLVLGGLFVQIAFFGFFMIVAFIWDRRIRKSPSEKSMRLMMKPPVHPWFRFQITWKLLLNTLYGASALILVRSIFRVVEYIQGHNGYLIGHEVWLYIFDALLMAGVVVAFNVVHPTDVLSVDEADTRGSLELDDLEENGSGKSGSVATR